jgi:hypothetical protein
MLGGAGGGGVEVDVGVEHLIRGVFDRPRPRGAVEAGLRGCSGGDGAEDVGAAPSGALGSDRVEDVVDGRGWLIASVLPRDVVGETLGSPPELGGLGQPPGPGLVEGELALGRSGVLGSLPFDRGGLSTCRVSPLSFAEGGEEDDLEVLDLKHSLGERFEQLRRKARYLGLAVDDRAPLGAVAVGALGTQHRLVEVAEGVLVVLEVVAVERVPPAVRRLDLAADDSVRVQLRVVLAGGGLLEHRHGEAVRIGEGPGAVHSHSGGAAVALEVGEGGADRRVVGVEHARVAGESPPDRDRFRCREGGVVTGDGPDDRAVLGEPVDERRTERRAGLRVMTRQDRFEIGGRNRAVEAEVGRLRARPLTRKFLGLLRVDVAGVAPILYGVVDGRGCGGRGVDRPHPQHGTPPGRRPAGHPARPAGSCLSC